MRGTLIENTGMMLGDTEFGCIAIGEFVRMPLCPDMQVLRERMKRRQERTHIQTVDKRNKSRLSRFLYLWVLQWKQRGKETGRKEKKIENWK